MREYFVCYLVRKRIENKIVHRYVTVFVTPERYATRHRLIGTTLRLAYVVAVYSAGYKVA